MPDRNATRKMIPGASVLSPFRHHGPMGYRAIRDLTDGIRYGAWLQIICGGCGKHTYASCEALGRVLDPGFHPGHERRFRCTLCGSGPRSIDICEGPPRPSAG